MPSAALSVSAAQRSARSLVPSSFPATCVTSTSYSTASLHAVSGAVRESLPQRVLLHKRNYRSVGIRVARNVVRASRSRSSAETAQQDAAATTAKDAVEQGLEAFQGGETLRALRLFHSAMQLRPTDDEARAALYNAACAHTKLREWQPAVDCVMQAVNEYDLKLQIALEDKDLAALRERREWLDVLGQFKGGLSDDAYTQLRSEAKAPFRLARLILLGGLLAGATLGLLISLSRLAAAVAGAENAPDLQETLQNLAINVSAVGVVGFFLQRDLQSQERDKAVVEREESLGKLQVAVSSTKQLPLASFRGACRPVLLAGTKGHIQKTLKSAEPFYLQLKERGVCLVPLEVNADDPGAKLKALKAEFTSSSAAKKGFAGGSKGSSTAAAATDSDAPDPKKDPRWQLEPYVVEEWLAWVAEQKKAAGVKGENVWVQVQLDGTVRSSGLGTPPWPKFISDLPELDDVRTKFTDGLGT